MECILSHIIFVRSLLVTGVFLPFFLAVTSCHVTLPDDVTLEKDKLPDEIDFNIDVKPILSDRCYACHGPDRAKRKAELRFDLEEVALGELEENPGKYAIRPGDLSSSQLVRRILSSDDEVMMPPPDSELNLSAYEKAVLIKWIENGADYAPHWAFIKPLRSEIPEVDKANKVTNVIDNFILQKIKRNQLTPSPEAGDEELLRRLYLDLTGLPPTIDQMDFFLRNDSPDAFEKVVDKLLSSPHYGERMATEWMDLARFADTHGYTVDRYRDMSPWRDWVIKAFNKKYAI